MKKKNDKCKQCGCARHWHEEGLGYCSGCNPEADLKKCLFFADDVKDLVSEEKWVSEVKEAVK